MSNPLIYLQPEQPRTTAKQDAREAARNRPADPETIPRLRWMIEMDGEAVTLDRASFDMARRDRLAGTLASLADRSVDEDTIHIAQWRADLHSIEVRRLFAVLKALAAETPKP